MSTLIDFLIENPVDDVHDKVVVSQRLKDHPFEIRAMSGPEFSECQKLSTKIGKKGKVDFNSQRFNELVVLNHTVEPNFRDAGAIKKAGCATPEQLLYKCLLSGEIAELATKISELSGFDRDFEETVDEAKNS